MGVKNESDSLWLASEKVTEEGKIPCTRSRVFLENVLRVFEAEGLDIKHLSRFAFEVAYAFEIAYGESKSMDEATANMIAMINATLDMGEAYDQTSIGASYRAVIEMLETHGFRDISRFITVPRELPRGIEDTQSPNARDMSSYTVFHAVEPERQLRPLHELSILANTAFLYERPKKLRKILKCIPYNGPTYAPAMRAGVRDYCISPSAYEQDDFGNILHATRLSQIGSYANKSQPDVFTELYLPVYRMSTRALEWAIDAISIDYDIQDRPSNKPFDNVEGAMRSTFFLGTAHRDLIVKIESLAPGLYFACMNVNRALGWEGLGIPIQQKHEIQLQAQWDAIFAQHVRCPNQMNRLAVG